MQKYYNTRNRPVYGLQHFHVIPGLTGKPGSVFAPQSRRPVFIGHVHVFKPLRFDNVIRAVVCQHHEIRLVMPKVASVVGVFNGKAELLRQLGKPNHVIRFFQKLRELLFKFVVARHEVENAFARLHCGTRPRELIFIESITVGINNVTGHHACAKYVWPGMFRIRG